MTTGSIQVAPFPTLSSAALIASALLLASPANAAPTVFEPVVVATVAEGGFGHAAAWAPGRMLAVVPTYEETMRALLLDDDGALMSEASLWPGVQPTATSDGTRFLVLFTSTEAGQDGMRGGFVDLDGTTSDPFAITDGNTDQRFAATFDGERYQVAWMQGIHTAAGIVFDVRTRPIDPDGTLGEEFSLYADVGADLGLDEAGDLRLACRPGACVATWTARAVLEYEIYSVAFTPGSPASAAPTAIEPSDSHDELSGGLAAGTDAFWLGSFDYAQARLRTLDAHGKLSGDSVIFGVTEVPQTGLFGVAETAGTVMGAWIAGETTHAELLDEATLTQQDVQLAVLPHPQLSGARVSTTKEGTFVVSYTLPSSEAFYSDLFTQRVTVDVSEPPTGAGGSSPGTSDPEADANVDSDCGCGVIGRSQGYGAETLFLLLGVASLCRRRRRATARDAG